MSSRRRRKTSRTRRLGGTEAQQRQAAETSIKFWHGGISDPSAGEQTGQSADADSGEPSAEAIVVSADIELSAETPRISVTPDPTSTVRSLGKPPLAGREAAAEHYFEAVYQRAVAMAGALAAAGGLLASDDEEFTAS